MYIKLHGPRLQHKEAFELEEGGCRDMQCCGVVLCLCVLQPTRTDSRRLKIPVVELESSVDNIHVH